MNLGAFIGNVPPQDGTVMKQRTVMGSNLMGTNLYRTTILGDLCADETGLGKCDNLYYLELYLPVGGEYTDFGATCGESSCNSDRDCVEYFKTSLR